MSSSGQYIFNGVDLGAYGIINNLVRPMPSRDVNTTKVSGKDGTVLRDSQLDQIEISMSLWITDLLPTERRAIVHEIAQYLNVDDVKPLKFGDDNGLYYLAIPKGDIQPIYYPTAVCIPLVFLAPDPVMYGSNEPIVSATTGSNLTTNINGTYTSRPIIKGISASPGQSGYWGVRLNDGDYMHVELEAGTHTVEIDCNARKVTIDGDVSMITLDSNWFVLEPGSNTIRIDVGSSSQLSAKYYPRWL